METNNEDFVIEQVLNGYVVRHPNHEYPSDKKYIKLVFEDNDTDELSAAEQLLWYVIEYFSFGGSRYDKERLRVVREQGDKYEEPKS